MGRKCFLFTITIGLAFAGIMPAGAVELVPPNELFDIREQRQEIQHDFKMKEKQLEEMGKKEQKYLEELKALDDEVALVNEKIRNLQSTLELTTQVIEEMKKEIGELGTRIDDRDRMIKERLRSLQEQEGLKLYIRMLMDSKSFSQLFDVTTLISTIMKADQELIQKHEKDLEKKDEQQKELKRRIATLESDRKEMESLKADLQKKVEEKQNYLDSLKEEKQQGESELMDLYEIYINLTSQEIAILKEKQIQRLEYLNLAPEEVFSMPTTGTLTSGYGPRWGKLHAGIDIANPAPDAKVVAAAAGTVIRSYYSASYGNCVLITHNVKGKTFTTLYAHLEKSIVTTGQIVNKGQMLGYMGNTGDSKGKHLHFEIHQGQWNPEKSNSIDPLTLLKPQ